MQYNVQGKELELAEMKRMLIPESEYQEKYRNRRFPEEICRIDKRFVAAGVTSKGRPECRPQEYDPSDGPVPRFSGETTSRSAHGPQPTLSRLPSSKPPPTQADTSTAVPERHRLAEVQSYSHYVHCPMPAELARKTAPVVALWIREKLRPPEYQPRYDWTSSYQADYCGSRTKPRKICLGKSIECNRGSGDYCGTTENVIPHPKPAEGPKEIPLHDYVDSLRYCTSSNRTYRPPNIPCHPSKH